MKKPLLIIGAGNVGGFLSYNIDEFEESYEIIGFLDDDPNKIGKAIYGRQVLGPVSDIRKYLDKQLSVAVGIANPTIKQRIVHILSGMDLDFPSFISRNAWVSKNVSIGKGCIIYPGTSINYECVLGSFVIMNLNCAIGHNCTISNFGTLAPGVNFAGFTYAEKGVDIGIGVSTRQNIRIGANAIIGGQAMLVKDVLPNTRVVGVPGRELF